ncbi:hypothetical protein DBR32_13655 [Taibaiella sp. KBW10]|nr:hypothetical protein DBR32_13655 [Taibaiella sp. KBW10]
MGTYGITEAANILTVNNLTGCTYTLGLDGGGLVTAGPGVTIFNSNPNANITIAKVAYWPGATIIAETAVGLGFPYGNTMGQPTPPCLTSSTYFTASWAQASASANATLVIF